MLNFILRTGICLGILEGVVVGLPVPSDKDNSRTRRFIPSAEFMIHRPIPIIGPAALTAAPSQLAPQATTLVPKDTDDGGKGVLAVPVSQKSTIPLKPWTLRDMSEEVRNWERDRISRESRPETEEPSSENSAGASTERTPASALILKRQNILEPRDRNAIQVKSWSFSAPTELGPGNIPRLKRDGNIPMGGVDSRTDDGISAANAVIGPLHVRARKSDEEDEMVKTRTHRDDDA
ncbi:hypothetical protein Ddc_18138 [Ditylenchus destructor]|nr:hypothetical protein Ddc_18138 [Ditylenchus destructor]